MITVMAVGGPEWASLLEMVELVCFHEMPVVGATGEGPAKGPVHREGCL